MATDTGPPSDHPTIGDMIPSGMTITHIHITVRSTALITPTGADTRTTTTIMDTVCIPGIQVTVILLTTTAAMISSQKPAAGVGTARWHVGLTPLLIQGASPAMLPEEI